MLFVSSIALGVITGFSTLLRAANFPNLLSAGWFISALLTVLLGVILLPYGGLNGALLSSMLVNLAGVFVMAFISRGVVK
jgi:O-antigen/teichoic acid export membrane protein